MTSTVAIPLGQGQVFNVYTLLDQDDYKSQSLWVRDRFLIEYGVRQDAFDASQSLWVRDRFLIKQPAGNALVRRSQSLWVRDRFLIRILRRV